VNTPDPSERTPYNTPLPGSLPPTPSASTQGGTPVPPTPPQAPRPAAPPQAPSAAARAPLASGKISTLTVVALAVACLSLILGLIGVGVGVSAQARSTQLQQQVDQLKAQQAEVDTTLAALDQRTGTSLADYLQGLDERLSQAESRANSALGRADEAATNARFAQDYAAAVDFRVDDVVACVNRYMKTVGDSGGGYYQYFFC